MIKSMTGYGRAAGDCAAGSLRVEVRTVNYKNFRFSPQLPDFLRYKETELEKFAASFVARGNLYLNVEAGLSKDAVGRLLDGEKLHSYIDAVCKVVGEGGINVTAEVSGLLGLPGVMDLNSLPDDMRGEMYGCLEGVLREALLGLDEMRRSEGESLQKHLLTLCESVQQRIVELSSMLPDALRAYQLRLEERVKKLLGESGISPESDSLSRELALMAERSDVAEEVERLDNHIKQFKKILGEYEQASGKKLEFLAQEMHREANTLGSKLPSADLVHLALEIKSDIHRLREQVMNVE